MEQAPASNDVRTFLEIDAGQIPKVTVGPSRFNCHRMAVFPCPSQQLSSIPGVGNLTLFNRPDPRTGNQPLSIGQALLAVLERACRQDQVSCEECDPVLVARHSEYFTMSLRQGVEITGTRRNR